MDKKFYRRNELALLGQGVLFFAGLTFIDGNSIVPVFISAMGGSLALAGFAGAIRVVPDILSQMLLGMRIGGVQNVPRYISTIMAVAYAMPLFMAAVLLLPLGTTATLFGFFLFLALLWIGDGSIVIGWYDLFGRAVEPNRRGLVLGLQQFIGGAMAVAGSLAVTAVLSNGAIPLRMRYAILFACAAVLMVSSAGSMAFARDVPHRQTVQENPLKHIARLPGLFRGNREFRRMAAVQAMQGIAVMCLPFVILFARQKFNLPTAQMAWLIPVQTVGSLSGGLVWGSVSNRLGNRSVVRLNQANLFFIALLGLTTAISGLYWLVFPLAFFTGISLACWMAYPNYIIDITEECDRPQYLVLSSLINLPFIFLPSLAGLLADHVGFVPVFAACLLAAVASVGLSRRLKPDLHHS